LTCRWKGDHEAAARDELDEALAPQGQQALADRGVADPYLLGDALDPQELARPHDARDDQLADVARDPLGS
jgi:hypothetical protein